MERVTAFVDGFNLYHAIDELREPHLKRVDLHCLSDVFIRPQTQVLQEVFYFSAFAGWLPGPFTRHQAYTAALRARGVTPVMGHFKSKQRRCKSCGAAWVAHEEKETDVNIAIALVRGPIATSTTTRS